MGTKQKEEIDRERAINLQEMCSSSPRLNTTFFLYNSNKRIYDSEQVFILT